MALAVEHLAGLGHRAIVFVDGPRGPIAGLRRQGYRQAVRRLLGADAVQVVGGGTEEDGARAARPWGPSPTAVVAFNDRCALGVLDRLRRDGIRVPEQVSVVGYDDSPLARLGTVDLTTVSQSPGHGRGRRGRGCRAARRHPERDDVVLPPHLVVRGTTAPPPAA